MTYRFSYEIAGGDTETQVLHVQQVRLPQVTPVLLLKQEYNNKTMGNKQQ